MVYLLVKYKDAVDVIKYIPRGDIIYRFGVLQQNLITAFKTGSDDAELIAHDYDNLRAAMWLMGFTTPSSRKLRKLYGKSL